MTNNIGKSMKRQTERESEREKNWRSKLIIADRYVGSGCTSTSTHHRMIIESSITECASAKLSMKSKWCSHSFIWFYFILMFEKQKKVLDNHASCFSWFVSSRIVFFYVYIEACRKNMSSISKSVDRWLMISLWFAAMLLIRGNWS